MKHRKLIGFISLILAVVLTVGTVVGVCATNYVGDVDGDGKITAFDAQLVAESNAGHRVLSEQQSAASKHSTLQSIINFLLGKTTADAGDFNNDGVIEIYTVAGLQMLHKDPAGNYILMNDLDLEGADWTPVANFSGTMNGKGKTISNFTINTSVKDTSTANVYNQGFFGDTALGVRITNLHLRDVTMNIAENATSIGFFAGSLRGHLTGCTVTGTLNDTRETYPSNVYTGVMAGKLNSGSEGSINSGTTLSITDEVGNTTTSGLCANVKLNITNDQLNIISGTARKVGVVGYAPSGYTVTGTWTDTTHSSSLLSETIQQRQNKVVNYMNAMGSVKWTPSENLVYTANNGTNQTFNVGTVYTGLPYNSHNGSYERFLSAMASQDANGVYTTKTGMTSGGWIESAINKFFIRLYTTSNSSTGETNAVLTKTTVIPSEAITFNTTNKTICYTVDGVSYYLGATNANENLHITGTSVSALPSHLYTISSSGKASIVSTPQTGTAYKLGCKNAAGSIVYFDGQALTLDGKKCLSTTTDLADATDVYLESVEGGYHLYFETTGAWSEDGFYLTMGNDCSGAVNWAWLQISNTIVSDGTNYANPYLGGAYVTTTNGMIPTDANREAYGIYPVGNWQPSVVVGTLSNGGEKRVSAEYDPSTAAYSCTDQTYTPAVLIDNGLDTILEAYAQTHKADALVCYVDRWSNGNPRPGGHVRLVAADPVIIRDVNGYIDSKASYLLMSEQGVGFSAGSTSTWNVNKKITLNMLAGNTAEADVTLSTKVYLPITIRALMEDYMRPTYMTSVSSGPVTSPIEGRLYTYNHINSVTVTVINGSDTVLYEHTAFTGIGTDYATYRGRNNDIQLADLHADAFNATAPSVLRAGRTYYYNVDVTLSTGEVVRFADHKIFTYTPLQ